MNSRTARITTSLRCTGAALPALALVLVMALALVLTEPSPASAATLTLALSYGDQGPQVATLQSDLDLLGYPIKVYTGYFGPVTQSRVRQFQRDQGLPVTGIVTAPTRKAVAGALAEHFNYVSAPLGGYPFTVGDTGPGVEDLQRLLSLKGYDPGPVNGVLMGKTVSALCRFQANQGVPVTAVVDPATVRALGVARAGGGSASGSATSPSRGGQTLTLPDGRTLTYRAAMRMAATAYDDTYESNGVWGPYAAWRGLRLAPGMIAVDPRVIPLGTRVYVTGYHSPNLPAGGFVGLAADTGGAIKGNRVDIYMEATPREVSDFGIQNVTVYILQ